jgi:hypothetical protein
MTQARHSVYSNAIVINDVDSQPVDQNHAIYISLVLRELLLASYHSTRDNKELGAIIRIELPAATIDDFGNLCYQLEVADNRIVSQSERIEPQDCPITSHLVDSGIAQVSVNHDADTEITVRFKFPAIESSIHQY